MQSFDESSEILKKISSGYKLAIIQSLLIKEKTVSELQTELNIEQSLLSHHLKELRGIGVLLSIREGKSVFYSMNTKLYSKKTKKIDLGCCALSFK